MFVFDDLINGRSLAAMAESTRTSLQGIAAQIQTTWFKQHARDGAHKDVTATSLRAGQIGANGIFTVVTTPSYEGGAPLDVPAGVSLVQLTVPATFSPLIYGIRQAGQQPGDILFIGPSPDAADPVFLLDRAAAVAGPPVPPLGTEIAFEASLTTYSGGAPLQFWINSTRSPVMLIYLPGRGTNGAGAWCIPQMVDTLSP